ncbi:MAG: hypothetical protein AAF449_04510 [Myxococcota bacterium]
MSEWGFRNSRLWPRVAVFLCLGAVGCHGPELSDDPNSGQRAEPLSEETAVDIVEPVFWKTPGAQRLESLEEKYNWGDFPELPEYVFEQPPPNAKAFEELGFDFGQLPSLFYVGVHIATRADAFALHELGVIMNDSPLFPEEWAQTAPTTAFIVDSESEGSETAGSVYMYALIPGAVLNQFAEYARAEGDLPAVELLMPPERFARPDGSVSWSSLAQNQFFFQPDPLGIDVELQSGTTLKEIRAAMDLEYEYAVNAIQQKSGQQKGTQRKKFGRRIRRFVRDVVDRVADRGRQLVTRTREFIGRAQRFFIGEGRIDATYRARLTDPSVVPDDDDMRQAWGNRFGLPINFTNTEVLARVETRVFGGAGVAIDAGRTDGAGFRSFRVAANRNVRLCIRTVGPAARVHDNLTLPTEVCGPANLRVNRDERRRVVQRLSTAASNVYAQMIDGHAFMQQALQTTPPQRAKHAPKLRKHALQLLQSNSNS